MVSPASFMTSTSGTRILPFTLYSLAIPLSLLVVLVLPPYKYIQNIS